METSRAPSGETYTPLLSPSPLHAMEVDQTSTDASSAHQSEFPLQQKPSMSSVSSCCSVAESKAEIKAMLDDFQIGLNRVLSSNLHEPLVISQQNSRKSYNSTGTDSEGTSIKACPHCNTNTISTMLSDFSCADCGVIVSSLPFDACSSVNTTVQVHVLSPQSQRLLSQSTWFSQVHERSGCDFPNSSLTVTSSEDTSSSGFLC